ncbi:VanZ family protein [Paenibacillus tarimensis]
MRIVLGVIWAFVLFLFTCSFHMWELFFSRELHFVMTKSPDFSDLFRTSDFDLKDSEWLVRKIGHLLGFFILALILTNFGKLRAGLYLSIGYAVFTEIIQLYFLRGGRIYDMLIDTAGVLLAYGICRLIRTTSIEPARNTRYNSTRR